MFAVYVLLASLAAILTLAAINALLGGWTRVRLGSLEEAARALAADNVVFAAGDGALAPDGRAAVVAEAGGGRFGLVVTQADRLVTRLFAPGDLSDARATPEGDLIVDPRDPTMPRVRVALKNPEIARSWAERLRAATDRPLKEAAHA